MILALGLVALRGKTICLDKPVIKFAKVIGHIENRKETGSERGKA